MASIKKMTAHVAHEERAVLEETDPIIGSYIILKSAPLLKDHGAILIVLPSEHEGRTWEHALRVWASEISNTPMFISLLTSPDADEQRILQQKLRTHERLVILVTEPILHSPVFTLDQSLACTQGSLFSPLTLRTALVDLGYEEQRNAFAPTSFSLHGDTVTIRTPDDRELRVDILGDAVESVFENGKQTTTIAIGANSLSYRKTTLEHLFVDSVALLCTMEGSDVDHIHARHHVVFSLESRDEIALDQNAKESLRQSFNAKRPALNSNTERRARPPRVDYAFLDNLKEGDAIVHRDHGIGRYTKRTRNSIDGIEKEFFIIEYAHNDKLFVPITYAGKLSKYVGAANPTIHRIGGTIWNQTRRNVHEQCMGIARDLAELYAKRERATGFAYSEDTPAMIDFERAFPYEPTPDQQRAINDIKHDMESDSPMDRLICGDVGFGKTEVAMRAAFKAVQDGVQVAVLAPTTILSQQHMDTFQKRFEGTSVRIAQLSRFETEREQEHTLAAIREGAISIVIGTHRLLSSDVVFKKLGLIIIDEEQRFGVVHKEHFKKFRANIDVLTLTATPIPRTLHMSVSGIRDISVIRTSPLKRKAVETIIHPFSTSLVREAITREHQRHGQVYYLYNKVETIAAKCEELRGWLKDWDLPMTIGIAHGQLPEERLSEIIRQFDRGEMDILFCSTIIQNGIDLPNVNTIIIDNAPDFGLTQLYQLKGRVGRRATQGYAYFLYHAHKLTPLARERLQALKDAQHLGAGFEIAVRDMEIRGTGNLLGKEQSGNIAAVGIGLYAHMLAEAINELESTTERSAERSIMTDATIDLPLAVSVPEDYAANERERLALVEMITQARDGDDLKARVELVKKTYGPLPREVANIATTFHINLLANEMRIVNIGTEKETVDDRQKETLVMTFADALTPEIIRRLLDVSSHWELRQDEQSARIPLSELGQQWPERLIAMLSKKN